MQQIQWTLNHMPASEEHPLRLMEAEQVAMARAFHASFPGYEPTPLVRLEKMAGALGLGKLYIKDESKRFGLNAFKVLGGSYAIARYAAEVAGQSAQGLTFAALTHPSMRQKLGNAVLYTATDGNHGRGVAWAARALGLRAVVRMPAGTAESRLENIRREGAEATIEAMNYDACVRLAAGQAAAASGGILVQDTAWPGYERVPGWIMQGYGTMVEEALEQMGSEAPPTHVFVQAGVGSLAGAVAGYLVNRFPDAPPKIVVVEADAAACHYLSAVQGNGETVTVDGDLATMMAGLACGEPNPLSWSILRNHASAFVSCPDWVSALGMRMLAAPMPGDAPVVSGESGAVGMGLTAAVMRGNETLRQALALGPESRVLLFSTEGDTDPEHYRRVVWGGACSPATMV